MSLQKVNYFGNMMSIEWYRHAIIGSVIRKMIDHVICNNADISCAVIQIKQDESSILNDTMSSKNLN